MFRKILFWTHLVMGCCGGLVILIMSFTGVLLTYEKQMLASIERGPYRIPAPGADVRRLAVEDLVAKATEQRPNGELPREATLVVRSDRTEPAEISAGREGAFYVNPYTGAILGEPSREWRGFFQKTTAWHRWLAAEGENRATFKAITGACNLAFLGLVVSGAYLWLPKKFSMQHLKPIVWFRGGLSGKARDFNWHNVFGLWALVPLFFVVITATPMSYQWADKLVYQLTGTEPPARPAGGPGGGGPGRGGPGGGGERRPIDVNGLNALWQKAESQAPADWKSISLRLPDSPRRPLSFSIDSGTGGQPQRRSTLILDRTSGEVVRHETFDSNNAGRRLRMWTRFVHTGEYYGVIGQTLAGLGSLAGVMLVWTGIALSLRRFAAWRKRRSRVQEQMPEAVAVDS
jgi:uncharacterized iron-regulated membrane protein